MRTWDERRIGVAFAAALVCLPSACLIEANPSFVVEGGAGQDSEPGGASETGTSGATQGAEDSSEEEPPATNAGCEDPNTYDCDDDGVCESDLSSIEHCGACNHSCAYEGISDTACVEGECVAELIVAAEADLTLVEGEDADDPGIVRLFANGGPVHREMLMRFATPEIAAYATPTAARLVFYSHRVTAPVDLFFIDEDWTQDEVNWPGPASSMVPEQDFVPSAGETNVPFDASLSWLAERPNHGLRVRSTNSNVAEFDSIEGAQAPRWVIELRW